MPTLENSNLILQFRSEKGYGICLVKKRMDGISYKYEEGKNILTIKKIF